MRHIFRQGPMLKTLFNTAASSLAGRRRKRDGPPPSPGPEIVATIPPRHPALVRDYLRYLGADPSAYRGELPPHFFPQWAIPLAARTIEGLPYDLARLLNGGCGFERRAPLPANEPLVVRAVLEEIDDNGQRALFKQRVITGTAAQPDALIAHAVAFLPLKKAEGGAKKERPHVPAAAREIARWKLPANAGLDYAKLTGDFNPLHWVRAYARMSGFKNVVLHGFATAARVVETLNRNLWAGRVDRLRSFEARFVRPIVLPARVSVFVDDRGGYFVGDAPGGPAYVLGSYTTREGD
jgi:hypothetical protein